MAKKQQKYEINAEMFASLIKKLFEENQIMIRVASDGKKLLATRIEKEVKP